MKLQTTYFGEIDYEESDLVFFPEGLYGFCHLKYYIPLPLDDGEGTLLSLQSAEEPDISFVIINPFSICPEYTPRLSPEDMKKLSLTSSEHASYYLICVMKDSLLKSTVDLRCPIVVNPENRNAVQVILDDSNYQFRQSLKDFIRQEDEHAHSAKKRK